MWVKRSAYKSMGYIQIATVYLKICIKAKTKQHFSCVENKQLSSAFNIIEPPRGKTNNVVSEQVRHRGWLVTGNFGFRK